MTDNRKRDDSGRPMLNFKGMGSSSTATKPIQAKEKPLSDRHKRLYNPEKYSRERFSATQIAQAREFVQKFALPETKKWLNKSQFGNDPQIIQAVLDTIARAQATAPGDPKLSYPDHLLGDLKSRMGEIQDYLESSIYEAKAQFIAEHGPLTSGLHPLDDVGDFGEMDGDKPEG